MRAIDLTWNGGEHSFLLTVDLLKALQERCDAGPRWVLARLLENRWYVEDVVETIRLGLEGGGLEKEEARKLVKWNVEERPLTESVLTAAYVLKYSLFGGGEEEDLGEANAAVGTR